MTTDTEIEQMAWIDAQLTPRCGYIAHSEVTPQDLPAEWAFHVKASPCGHDPAHVTLTCTPCKELLLRIGMFHCNTVGCPAEWPSTYIILSVERL